MCGLNFLHVEINSVTSKVIIRANDKNDICPITTPPTVHFPFDYNDSLYSPNFKFTINFENDNAPLYKTAGWMMGFRKPSYKLSYTNFLTDYTTSSTTKIIYRCRLESESSYGNDVDNYFFLYIEDYNKNYVTDIVTSYTNKSYMGSNTMARIGITTNHYTVINDTAQDLVFKKREYFGPVNIDKLTIKLLDKYGDEIDNLDNNYSMVLKLIILN